MLSASQPSAVSWKAANQNRGGPRGWLQRVAGAGTEAALPQLDADSLALPATLHHRELIITLTFGAVIVSILVQGMTMGPLLKALKLVHARSERGQYEMERGAQQAATQALASLDVMAREAQAHPDVIATLRADYEALRDAAAARIADLHLKTSELQEEELHATRRTLLLGEKDTVLRMLRTGSISGDAAEHLLRDIDARLVALEDTLGDSSGH